MRILFKKLTDERHELAVSRAPESWETFDCETRSYLTHDLLHYAVEVEAGVQSGFWGRLAAGATLAEMNDRTRPMDDEMAAIEQVVGALTSSVKGMPAAEVVAGMNRFASSLGSTMPSWLTEAFVLAVQERMRNLLGRWKATPRGSALDLTWPGP
ncbi:MAG TPA: hypothetical protein VKU41_00905 [Polyangiaceae bacterium]|nr:hypothetical protein [Polyangiaceae bacterium]